MTSVNSVKVLSIDEERLKFRFIASFNAQLITQGEGQYTVLLEPPTSFANSDHYQACEITLDAMTANCASAIADPTWTAQGANTKVGALVVRLDVPSSQTTTQLCNTAASTNVGIARIGGFASMVSLIAQDVGDNTGAFNLVNGRGRCWQGVGVGGGVVCANPFGRQVTIQNLDSVTMNRCFLKSAGGANNDIGVYVYQFTIQMIPNK